MATDRSYTNVLLEELQGNVRAILEIVIPMRAELTEMRQSVDRIPHIETDIKAIKAVLKITNQQVADHEHRITKLETRAA